MSLADPLPCRVPRRPSPLPRGVRRAGGSALSPALCCRPLGPCPGPAAADQAAPWSPAPACARVLSLCGVGTRVRRGPAESEVRGDSVGSCQRVPERPPPRPLVAPAIGGTWCWPLFIALVGATWGRRPRPRVLNGVERPFLSLDTCVWCLPKGLPKGYVSVTCRASSCVLGTGPSADA